MTSHSLSLLLDFDACAQRDNGQTPVFLHRRDRKFALTCEQQGVKPSPQRWLEHIKHFSNLGGLGAENTKVSASAQTLRFWHRINRGFMLAGTLFGILSMLGLLFYDGGQRINVTVILAFVAFQLLLALLTTVQSLVGWQPWGALLRRFRRNPEAGVSIKLQPVFMARAAQLGGLCFAMAGLITLLLMVVLQDLAFGWSTTLETGASSYHHMIITIAAPWAWLWPAATPEIALVEATRFFRASASQSNINPAQWGQWWPYITMLWITWALLPRLVLFILAGALIERKAKRLLNNHAALRALMYRMETPTLDTGNEHNDAADLPDTKTQLRVQALPDANVLLCWAGAGDPEIPTSLSTDIRLKAKAGGRMTLAEDLQVLQQVSAQLTQTSSRNVLLLTRSWEPPTGELEDFIANAKELWPSDAVMVLVPLATSMTLEPDAHQVQQWLRFAKRIDARFVSVSLIPIHNSVSAANQGVME